MRKLFITVLSSVRSIILRIFRPSSSYFLATKAVKPLSRKFGFDRGTPIDRLWIENYVKDHSDDIKGVVLEIGDNRYTTQFGNKRVTKSIILDIDPKNKRAEIHADLSNVTQVPDNTFDCIVLTHVLGIVPEYSQAIAECYRMLKRGGVVLVTASCISPVQSHSPSLWRFTPKGLEYAFGKYFSLKNIQTTSYGNVLTGQCFWVGLSQEELTREQLLFNDPEYPCIACVRAVK